MFHKKAEAVALSFAIVLVSATGTGTAAAAIRQYNPWARDTVYALAPDDSYVAEWMGLSAGWTIIGGPAKQVYAGSAGVFELDASGNIWMYDGTPYSWTEIGGPPASAALGDSTLGDLAVGSGAVYRIDPTTAAGDTVIAEWTGGTTWSPLLTLGSGNYPSNLIAGYDGVYYEDITSTTDGFFKYNGTPNSWSQIAERDYYGDGLTPEVESSTNLYGATLDPLNGGPASTDVEVYSGSGSSWTVIGGPADELAAGD